MEWEGAVNRVGLPLKKNAIDLSSENAREWKQKMEVKMRTKLCSTIKWMKSKVYIRALSMLWRRKRWNKRGWRNLLELNNSE